MLSFISQKHLKFGTVNSNQNGGRGSLLNLTIDFFDARKQRVALNGQYSSMASVKAGFIQRSILGHLFFLIFIDDLSDNLVSNPNSLQMIRLLSLFGCPGYPFISKEFK